MLAIGSSLFVVHNISFHYYYIIVQHIYAKHTLRYIVTPETTKQAIVAQ